MPMPTKQTILSRSWRAAAIVMISSAVYPRSLTQRLLRGGFEAGLEIREIARARHMARHPGLERLALARDAVPGLIKSVVALVIALGIRRPGTMRHEADGAHDEMRENAGVGRGFQALDDFLHGYDGTLGGQDDLLLHAHDSPQQHIAAAIGALGMDHTHIGPHRRNGGKLLARKGTGDALDRGIHLGKIVADMAAEYGEGQSAGSGGIGVGHVGMDALVDLQRLRPILFDRLAQSVERAHARIASPGEDQLARQAHADDLVIDQIGGHADQCQIALALANRLQRRRRGDQMGKAFEGDAIAVLDQMPHRLGQTRNFRHVPPAGPLLRFNTPKLSRLWPVSVKRKTIAPRLVRRFVCADPISKEGEATLGGRHGKTGTELCSRHIRLAADRRHHRRPSRPDGQARARPAGVILVNINPAYRLYELEYALNKAGCAGLILAPSSKTSDFLAMIASLCP